MQVSVDAHNLKGGDTHTIHHPSLSLLTSPFSHSDATELQTALLEAESLVDQRQPSRALALCRDAIQNWSNQFDRDLGLAWLHLTAGRAILEEVALSRPVLLEELWGDGVSGGVVQKRGRGRKGVRVLGWVSLMPEPFQESLDHFCAALQLCHPSCPSQLLREVLIYFLGCTKVFAHPNMHTYTRTRRCTGG